MKSNVFPLPGTGYPQLEDVIKLYFSVDDYVVVPYLLKVSKIRGENISRNHDFLIAAGIMEVMDGNKLKKRLTLSGKKLGKAIQNGLREEISQCWHEIIENVDYFKKLKNSIIKSSPITNKNIKDMICRISGKFSQPYTARAMVSAKTIIDILDVTGFVKLKYTGKVRYYHVLSGIENKNETDNNSVKILNLLHPNIIKSSHHHFINGHYRDAVLNAFVAVFDLIRERTKLDLDGTNLAQTVFSPNSPKLIVSTLLTESGKNEQVGFMKLLEGAYFSIRNPKAHSLLDKSDKLTAAQNLVFASLLAKRVEEATEP